MSDLIQPTPLKGANKKGAIEIAFHLLIELKNNYMVERENSNNLKLFLKYIDNIFHEKDAEIRDKKTFATKFLDDSVIEIGKNTPEMKAIAQNDQLEALHNSAKFIYSLVALYVSDASNKQNDLNRFIEWTKKYLSDNFA